MSRSIPDELAALALGEDGAVHGVRVVRCSLFGFQLDGRPEVLDAGAAAARIAARSSTRGSRASAAARAAASAAARAAVPAKAVPVRVEVCFRCSGDGLGRRDRGVCPVCHGKGVQVVEPAEGWAAAPAAQVAAAVDQAAIALRSARHTRARETLVALLATLAPLSGRPLGDVRKTEPPPATPGAAA
jgi:hypothetical protein